jgi:hypothetical protein
MDKQKTRDLFLRMLSRCDRVIRDCELRAKHRPDQPPIDVEWFRVMRSKAEAGLQALDTGDDAAVKRAIQEIAFAKDAPLWDTVASDITLPSLEGQTEEKDGDAVKYEPPKVLIDRVEMAAGWVCFLATEPPAKPEELPLYLSQSVSAWLRQTPTLTVRATLPIVSNGNTIAVHVWFD